jgi:hypothetical protein
VFHRAMLDPRTHLRQYLEIGAVIPLSYRTARTHGRWWKLVNALEIVRLNRFTRTACAYAFSTRAADSTPGNAFRCTSRVFPGELNARELVSGFLLSNGVRQFRLIAAGYRRNANKVLGGVHYAGHDAAVGTEFNAREVDVSASAAKPALALLFDPTPEKAGASPRSVCLLGQAGRKAAWLSSRRY